MAETQRPETSTAEYIGGVLWAVRWSEDGHTPVIRDCIDESAARGLHTYLRARYTEQGRAESPELLTAQLIWKQIE